MSDLTHEFVNAVARRWFDQDPEAWREDGVDGPDDLRKSVRQVLTCAEQEREGQA